MSFTRFFRQCRLLRYIIAGGAGASVHLSVLFILTETMGLWYIASTTVGFCGAFLVSFILQKFWTFNDRSREQRSRQLVLFFLVALGNLLLNAVLMYAIVSTIGISYFVAQLVVTGSIAVESFFIYRSYIFRDSRE